LDAHFENLAQRADLTKKWTEKLVADTHSVIIPNPGYRLEDFFVEKIENRKPNRMSNLEWLGMDMISAGNEYGPGTAYGLFGIKPSTFSAFVVIIFHHEDIIVARIYLAYCDSVDHSSYCGLANN
jgi:hypothetical protein